MVERELGDDARSDVAAHATRLIALGVADDADLARAIRDGRVDDRLAAVRATVWIDVLAKVRVANPSYLLPQDRPAQT
jgi:hypothetical protein